MTDKVTDAVEHEDTEFESAFDEFSSAKDDANAVGAQQASDDADQVDDPAAGAGDDPGPSARQADGEGDPGDGGEADPDQLLESAPPELKSLYQQLQEERDQLRHKYDSNVGRVSAYQRKVAELTNQIESIRQGSTSGEDQPSQADIVAAMTGSPEDWAEFAQDYPVIAKAIDGRLEAAGKATKRTLDQTLAPVNSYLERTAQQEAADAEQASTGAVTEVFPTWTEEVSKPEFAQWLDEQSLGVASLADSPEPGDAVALIDMYNQHRVSQGLPSLRKTDDQDPGDGVNVNEADRTQSSLAKRRQQQLEAGANVSSKASGFDASSAPVDEYEANFEYFAKKKDERRAANTH